MPICIYCCEEKSQEAFTNTEHVLPQAFGKFQDNLTLPPIICNDCNQHFGDTLELALGRDTLEGRKRFEYGVRPIAAFKSYGSNSRITVKAQEGILSGAFLEHMAVPGQDKLSVSVAQQVGIRRHDGSFSWYRLTEIPEFSEEIASEFDLKGTDPYLVFERGDDSIKDELKSKGWSFQETRAFEEEPEREWMTCGMYATVDHEIQRAITKVAFNYLAYTHGGSFVLLPAFDQIRRYIRFTEAPEYKVIQLSHESVLFNERDSDSRILGHVITIGRAADESAIISNVSLFNDTKYTICLARSDCADLPLTTSGVFFNINDMSILPLRTSNA